MVKRRPSWALLGAVLWPASAAWAQQPGSIRGTVYDKDYDAPLPLAQVLIVETGAKVTGSDDGKFTFGLVPPGSYTLVFSKDGYARQVKANVVVNAGQMTEVEAWLSGEFTEMEEVVAQDLPVGGASEIGLLNLRQESAALMDSIGSQLLTLAGASDAAAALRLVSGASVQDGKYAVIRGLPDRYVNSQLNGFRLPTADAEKRSVQLDQFPASVIESIQVTKTFTPDQQGDASGGAVNVVLKGVPEESFFQIGGQYSYNTQVTGRKDFLTCDGCGLNYWGLDNGSRDIPSDGNFDGPMGVTTGEAPTDYKWNVAGGGSKDFGDIRIGGIASFYYEADSAFFDNGIDDNLWVDAPGQGLSPQYIQGAPSLGEFKTQLFDVTQGTTSVQWAALGQLGLETEHNELTFAYLYTQATSQQATLAEDTRGKQFFFPGHDPNDPTTPGHDNLDAAPYLRTETLEYNERNTQSYQLKGKHTLDFTQFGNAPFAMLPSTIDWGFAYSVADLHQPDKTQFGELWQPERVFPFPGIPPIPPTHRLFKPAVNFTLGNLQRIWKDITEDSNQYYANWTFPFKQWSDNEGYFKFGYFSDNVNRDLTQESFSNFDDNGSTFVGAFEEHWSSHWLEETQNGQHPITAAEIDVDSNGEQNISAWYAMMDLPLVPDLNLIGGVRVEDTEINIVNIAEVDVTWVPPGASGPQQLLPGDADVFFNQQNVLPAVALVYQPIENLTFRASYAQTVARQTFRELTPIIQQEFLGGPIFIGNPILQMSDVTNYDLRVDFTPYPDTLLSASYFYKDVTKPIEYVQGNAGFTFTTPANFPRGTLSGIELEARHDLGHLWDPLKGLGFGVNATFIDSHAYLPQAEIDLFAGLGVPVTSRDMTGAPDYLFNAYLTYDLESTGTQIGLFYTLTGDTLVAGAGNSNGHFVPDIYQVPQDTLNFSVTQKLGKVIKLQFQAKNLTNAPIETVYRAPNLPDAVHTSYTDGIEFSISLSATFNF